ncbi:MAG: hypothetical protein J6S85_11110 [Methanobrevibacter sp.]|nr:hypothetical protein [Methanobrevibacter sp.]
MLKFNNNLFSFDSPIYNVNILSSEYGTVSALPMSGYSHSTVTLTNTPREGSKFIGYDISGSFLYDENKFDFYKSDVTVQGRFTHYDYITLWETNEPFKNLYSITLTDSIENYDEYIVYGSANRTNQFYLDTQNRYVVNHTGVNQGGCFYAGRWSTASTYILINGTEMWLNGTSGYIQSSFFVGQNDNSTNFCDGVYINREEDLHPYKIVGVKEVK